MSRIAMHTGWVACLLCLTVWTGPAQAQYYPYYNPYYSPYWGAGGAMMGAANVISSQGELLTQREQARVLREKANQEKVVTKRKAFDEAMYEKANTPSFSEEMEKTKGLQVRRIMNDPTEAEITSGKAHNMLLPMLLALTHQGIQGPPVSINPSLLQQVNVTVGTDGNVGMLKNGGRLDWPLPLRGPTQKKLDAILPQAVSASAQGTLDSQVYNQVKGGVSSLHQELSSKFRKEQIDGGEYLEGKRFLEKLDSAVKMLGKAYASKLLDGSYAARGNNVQELVASMSQQGLQFAPSTPGGEPAYHSLFNSMVAYAHGAQTSTGFQARFGPPPQNK